MRIKARKLTTVQALRGLIGARSIKPVYFETSFGIHTFLMEKPIDIIILDKKNTIVKLKSDLQPNRFFFWTPKYNRVVELGSGFILKKNLRTGMTLMLDFV